MQWGIHYALSYGKVRKCGTNCGGLGGFALFKVHIVCSRDFGSGVSNFSTFPLCLLDVWREGVKCLVCGVHFLANLCRTYNYLFYCKLNIFIAQCRLLNNRINLVRVEGIQIISPYPCQCDLYFSSFKRKMLWGQGKNSL